MATIRVDDPVIKIDKWIPRNVDVEHERDWMTCQLDDCDGLIFPMRQDKPPHCIRNDLYCALCGQRYHFNNLGEVYEQENETFRKFYAKKNFQNN